MIRQFLADVAHEIATPVNAVSGLALALADGAVQSVHERDEANSVISSKSDVCEICCAICGSSHNSISRKAFP